MVESGFFSCFDATHSFLRSTFGNLHVKPELGVLALLITLTSDFIFCVGFFVWEFADALRQDRRNCCPIVEARGYG